ncbi:MAG: RNA-binding transcriptional accessory protein [Proteobacteria bacterium]|nr:RNA-binding transcriptional accessory protein [Pseudomonadota bacterium]
MDKQKIAAIIAAELNLQESSVSAVIELLGESATVPFIARYRKERTGGLDEVQIRTIEERQTYLIEFHERRVAILKEIESQGKLTPELKKQIEDAPTKAVLEDLYLPYKPKRRTRAMIAREKGLEGLANAILAQGHEGTPEALAAGYVNAELGVDSIEKALDGASDIVAEVVSETAVVRDYLRQYMTDSGEMVSECTDKAEEERSKFEQYYNYRAPLSECKGHRFLAIRRGEREGFLRAGIEVNDETAVNQIAGLMHFEPSSPFGSVLVDACQDAYERLLQSSIESDVRVDLKVNADREAVDVFAQNAEKLLLASPLGAEAVIGIDPGFRTGCKVVALDATGKFLDNTVIYPEVKNEALAKKTLLDFMSRYPSRAIAIGNGTAGRETEAFVRQLVETLPENQRPYVVMVSESGASIYSASDIAREEFPDLDLTVRGAISIGRRLQDPLAELVKIDPKSIGVGQYQHDVHQPLLKRKLEEVVESCVNRVGVELNTASAALLSYVAGIGPSMAKKIVAHREKNGSFASRAQLLKVTGLGPKTFEQAAGFIRVRESDNPLDRSAVHPERYKLVEKIAADMGISVRDLVGNAVLAGKINISKYVSDDVGLMTLNDIVAELQKPGRDPRAQFEPPKFNADVTKIEDLKVGMILDGIVTNVTNFGAFVDIGVHQDGLVHISALCDRFITNPAEVVSVGDAVRVRVTEVDVVRSRIALSCRLQDGNTAEKSKTQAGNAANKAGQSRSGKGNAKKRDNEHNYQTQGGFNNNPFASLKR